MDIKIRKSTPADGPALVAIWAAAVDATHGFLTAEDRRTIEEEVRSYLPDAPLLVAVTAEGDPVGFIHAEVGHIHALFVHAHSHGKGVGRRLIEEIWSVQQPLLVEVNEQNAQGVHFYQHIGFRQVGRSSSDDMGRPYPLLHMELDKLPPSKRLAT